MADHVIENTPEVDSIAARPRVSTEQRGGDLEPDGDQSAGPTDSPRGKMPKSAGGPPEPHAAHVGKGPQGAPKEPQIPANAQIPPVATRRSADEPTRTNPVK